MSTESNMEESKVLESRNIVLKNKHSEILEMNSGVLRQMLQGERVIDDNVENNDKLTSIMREQKETIEN